MGHQAGAPAEEVGAAEAGAAEAAAEDPNDKAASKAAEAAKKAFRLNDYEGAVEKFREAYAANGSPNYLFNIAISYERWGENKGEIQAFRDAVSAYKNFRGEEIRAVRNDGATEAEIADIKKQLDEKIAKIEAKIAALEEKAEAEAEREQAALLAAERQATAEAKAAASKTESPVMITIPAEDDVPVKGRGVLYTGYSFIALAGLSTVVMAWGLVEGNELDQENERIGGGADVKELYGDGRRTNIMAYGGAIGMLVFGASGVAMTLIGKRRARDSRRRTLKVGAAPALSPTTAGVTLGGRF